MVKKRLIVWDVFISIMDSLTFTFAKSRQLNEILLGELKTHLQVAKPSDEITTETNLEFEGTNESTNLNVDGQDIDKVEVVTVDFQDDDDDFEFTEENLEKTLNLTKSNLKQVTKC